MTERHDMTREELEAIAHCGGMQESRKPTPPPAKFDLDRSIDEIDHRFRSVAFGATPKPWINRLSEAAHTRARASGFWDPIGYSQAMSETGVPDPDEPLCPLGEMAIAQKVALIHSEVSEALEALRDGHIHMTRGECGKPEGFVVELADAIIRIADVAGAMKLDLDAAIVAKVEYNTERPRRHGKRF